MGLVWHVRADRRCCIAVTLSLGLRGKVEEGRALAGPSPTAEVAGLHLGARGAGVEELVHTGGDFVEEGHALTRVAGLTEALGLCHSEVALVRVRSEPLVLGDPRLEVGMLTNLSVRLDGGGFIVILLRGRGWGGKLDELLGKLSEDF